MMKTVVLLVVLQLAIGANLPDKFKRCHVNEPDGSSCLKVAVADALRKIGTTGIRRDIDEICALLGYYAASCGIPSLNVDPLQPMTVKEVKVDQGGNGPVAIKLQFTNLKIYGIPESSVLSFGLDKYVMKAESLTPEFKFDADYVLEGQLLLLPIRGRGKCTISLDSLITYHDIRGKPVTRKGDTYLDLQTYEIKMRTKKMNLNFRNLFNGDKALGETMNKVINENWELIFKELRPALEKAFGDVFLEYAKGIFDKVPFYNIFLK